MRNPKLVLVLKTNSHRQQKYWRKSILQLLANPAVARPVPAGMACHDRAYNTASPSSWLVMSLLPLPGPEVPCFPWGYRGTTVWPPVPVLLPPLPPESVPWPRLYLCLGCLIPNHPIISFGDAFLWLPGAKIAAAQGTTLSCLFSIAPTIFCTELHQASIKMRSSQHLGSTSESRFASPAVHTRRRHPVPVQHHGTYIAAQKTYDIVYHGEDSW